MNIEKNDIRSMTDYKYVHFLMMLFMSSFLVCEVTAWRMIAIFGHVIPACGLVIAFVFFLGDIIAEVYGYHISRKLIWNALICQIIFGLFVTFIVNLPSPSNDYINEDYKQVFLHLLRTNISSCFSVSAGMFTNAFLMSKLKIRMNGKKFICRIILSSGISEAVLCIVAYVLIFGGVKSIYTIAYMIFIVWSYKMIFAVLSSFFAPFVTNWLKDKEKSDVYDINVNYSPFKYNSA